MELSVVMTILGLLAAILLPAIGSVRESSRRIHCLNNLHQIGLSAQNYESSWGVFPGTDRWYRQLLPHLEQPSTASTFTGYRCASDIFATGDFVNLKFSYRVNDGTWRVEGNGFSAATARKQHDSADITDGLSNTSAFAEKLAWPDFAPSVVPTGSFPETWSRRVHNLDKFLPDLDAFDAACQLHPLPPGPGWQVVTSYNHVSAPNGNSCFNGPVTDPKATMFWSIASSSQHPGGVQIVYADSHVRFVSSEVDVSVWRSLGTRAGSEYAVYR